MLTVNILWPKWPIVIGGPYTYRTSILTLGQSIVSLELIKYSLVYKLYIGFIVTQVLNIICNRQRLSHGRCRPLGSFVAHHLIITHNHRATFTLTSFMLTKVMQMQSLKYLFCKLKAGFDMFHDMCLLVYMCE